MDWLYILLPIVVISVIILLILLKHNTKVSTFEIENVVGMRCVVTESVDNSAGCGQVKVGNSGWSARGAGENDRFEVGEVLKVVAVEGVRLVCMK
jgi:membrane protein implicated in regulation of membrane protease activity